MYMSFEVLIPLLVATKLASYEESAAWSNPLFIITARNYAREAVHRIGTLSLTTGCLLHDFQVCTGERRILYIKNLAFTLHSLSHENY